MGVPVGVVAPGTAKTIYPVGTTPDAGAVHETVPASSVKQAFATVTLFNVPENWVVKDCTAP